MKLMRLTTNYPIYIQKFYSENNYLVNYTYKQQYQILMADCFGWADFWTNAFKSLNYEVWEPVANAEIQQKQWANENFIKYNESNWILEITLKQVVYFKPDILLINDYHTFTYNFLELVKEKVPSIRMIIGWCGAPFKDEKVFKAYDLILTNLPIHYKNFRNKGFYCEKMNHAFDPRILDKLSTTNKKENFTFVGSIVRGEGFHNERLELLNYLIEKTDLKIFSDVFPKNIQEYEILEKKIFWNQVFKYLLPYRFSLTRKLKIKIFNKFGIDIIHKNIIESMYPKKLISKTEPGLYGLSMYQKLKDSLITLNQHIDISKGSSNNMRLFEATGVGALVLTDWSEDLKDLFEDDFEIVTYKSKSELIDKLNYLRENPRVLEEISKRGQARTLKENKISDRANWLDRIIKKYI